MKFRLSKKSILKGLEGRLGENDYLEPLEHLIESFKNESRLNLAGNLGVRHQLINRLKVRAQLHDFIEDKNLPEPANPLFVMGLPRSGTTFLFDLLSCDQQYRSPLFWEITRPFPLVEKDSREAKKRIKQTNRELGLARKFIPNLLGMHHIHAEMPEECSLINTMNVRSFIFMCMANSPSYEKFLKTCDFSDTFMWHKRFLQALETQDKPEKWLLKDPSHISHTPELVSTYPGAKFIHIHRNPVKSIGSLSSLTMSVRSGLSNHANPHKIGAAVLDFWQYAIEKSISDRSKHLTSEQIIDIDYRDFIKEPLEQIKHIYQHFNFELSQSTLDRMQAYMDNQSKEDHEPHHYALKDFGLDEDMVQEAFSNYNRIHNF